MFVIGGIVAQLCGVAALREAQQRRNTLLLAFAALTIVASAWLMAAELGWELGVTWSLTTISVAAYALILLPFLRSNTIGHYRAPRDGRRAPAPPSGSKARLSVRLLSAGPLYLIAALAISLVIATKPWATEITRLFVGGLSTPLWWSLGALHATVDPDLRRIICLPILLTAIFAGAFFLL